MPMPSMDGTTNTIYYSTDYYTIASSEFTNESGNTYSDLYVDSLNYSNFISERVDYYFKSINMPNFYSIDENHFVFSIENSRVTRNQVSTSSGNDTQINKRTNKATIYFTKDNNDYTIDYFYEKNTLTSNYIFNPYNGNYTKVDDDTLINVDEQEVTFKYNRTEYEDLDNLLKKFDTKINFANGEFTEYDIEFDENDESKITGADYSYDDSMNTEILENEGNNYNADIQANLTGDCLYKFGAGFSVISVNPKILANQKLESGESTINESYPIISLDFSNVELPENFELVTIENETYLRITVPEYKEYMVIMNIDATTDYQNNTGTAKVNSIDVFEFEDNNNYVKLI